MESKTIVSSRGQVVIPKSIRDALGIHSGSILFLSVKDDHILELTPMHQDIRNFFGKGASHVRDKKMSLKDIDTAIAKAVMEENSEEK